MGELIYCLDDEESICELYQASLEMASFSCRTFLDVPSFFEGLKEKTPDLIILDIMLPGEDGISVLKRLQQNSLTKDVPVILVSAKDKETDKVLGLNEGASDYLAKPFGVLELLARVKANLRKLKKSGKSLSYEDLKVVEDNHEILLGDVPMTLSVTEYRLLKYFIENPEKVLSKETLMNDVWGINKDVETRSLDMFVSKLRKKLASSKARIDTVRGVGYVLKS